MNIVITSGGFDPLHIGHLEYLKQAKEAVEENKHICIVNSDAFLRIKKGYALLPSEQRIRVVQALRDVDEVVASIDADTSVINTLALLRHKYPEDALYFCKGGDRTKEEIPEKEYCEKHDITIIDGLGEKIESSSHLVDAVLQSKKTNKPWGYYETIHSSEGLVIKLLHISQYQSLSMQKHMHRSEFWYCIKGEGVFTRNGRHYFFSEGCTETIAKGVVHSLQSNVKELLVLEVQTGETISEDDIIRLADKYNRI